MFEEKILKLEVCRRVMARREFADRFHDGSCGGKVMRPGSKSSPTGLTISHELRMLQAAEKRFGDFLMGLRPLQEGMALLLRLREGRADRV